MHDSMSNEVPILKKQILLVEDETVFANAVKKHLSRKGYEIYLPSDLKSANLHLNENIPDLILLDVGLSFLIATNLLEYIAIVSILHYQAILNQHQY